MIGRRRAFIINSVYFLLIIGLVYLSLRLVFSVAAPFLLGFAIAAIINPIIRFLTKKFDMHRRPAGILLLLIFYATIGMLATILIVRLVILIGRLSEALPGIYYERIEPLLSAGFELINRAAEWLDRVLGGRGGSTSELGGFFNQITSSLGSAVTDLSVKALTRLSGIAAAIPEVVIAAVFAMISSFFFTVDFESIMSFLRRLLPERTVKLLSELRGRGLAATGRYLRSYLLILLITFAELSLGFILLRVAKPFATALAIASFDILPVVGTGGIIVPWALASLIGGEYGFAAGLLLVWAIVTVVRNIIEPKIIGNQVGLHPLVTLVAMFAGTKLFGIAGLFLLPITLAVFAPVFKERFAVK